MRVQRFRGSPFRVILESQKLKTVEPCLALRSLKGEGGNL